MMQASTTTSRPRRLLAVVGAIGILLGGCGGDDSADAEVTTELAQAAQGGGDDLGAEEPAATEAQGDVDEDAVVPGAATDRERISRARIALSSDDPDQTVDEVEASVRDAGGFVASAQLRRDDLDLLRGSITFRVPADSFDGLVAELGDSPEFDDLDRTDEDVTGQVADLESRLRNLRALEEELLVLLTEARERGDIDDVLAVFDRVGQVREEVEVLQGRRDDLGDQVALSTLTVQVEPSPALVESRTSEPDDELPLPWSPGNAAASAVDATVAALQSFVDAVIRVALFLVPVLVVWLSPLWLALGLFWWWRRRRDRDAGTPGTAGSPAVAPAPPVAPGGDSTDPAEQEVDDDPDGDHHGGERQAVDADRSRT